MCQLFLFLCIPFFVVLYTSYNKLKEEYFQETRNYKNPILAIDRNYKDSQSFDEQNAPNAYFYFDGKINKEKSNSRFSSRWAFSV